MTARRLLAWLLAEGDRSPARIRERVLAAPSVSELLVVGSIMLIVALSGGGAGSGIDWDIYAGAADGQMVSDRNLGYYYPYWLLPLFDLFDLGGHLGAFAWAMANVVGVWFASRVFGARSAVVLAGFGALEGFYTGTITGVALGALAGLAWAVRAERWTLAGALAMVSVAKPQWGIPLTALIVFQARPPLRAFARLALVPVPVVATSFAAYGWWPGEILDRIDRLPPVGNGSAWIVVGAAALLLWLPVGLAMEPSRRLALVAATAMLASPYVQHYDFPVLWVLATDGLGLVSHLFGPLTSVVSERVTRGILLVAPLTTYVVLAKDPCRRWWAERSAQGGPLEQPA